MTYEINFHDDWQKYFSKLDKSIKIRILKVIKKHLSESHSRHLRHGLDFFVDEIGQHRLIFKINGGIKTFYFVGTHKEYEKWCLSPTQQR